MTGISIEILKSCILTAVVATVLFSCGDERQETSEKEEARVETVADLGALPLKAVDPADNPSTPEKAALGRLLFFDPVLSGNKDVACATCHQPEFNYAEFLETSIGVNGVGRGQSRRFVDPNDIPFVKRNSQSVLNTAFNGLRNNETYDPASAPMFWDMRAKGLEQQALEPIKTLEEMRGNGFHESGILDEVITRLSRIPEYRRLFAVAFPREQSPVSKQNLARALAAYERTLIATNTRFDQYMRGDSNALSTGEKEGMNAFLVTGCAKCHSGPMFSDFKLHTLGVPDTENRKDSDSGADKKYAFRTPSLRNLRFTAPYMHSGKFATLDQVLMFYEDIAGGKLLNPNVEESRMDPLATHMDVNFKDISRIVEFLNTLNDDAFDKSVPESVPSGLPVMGR
ncbi:MAG: cytochrome-c peroxidase [Dyadobacter sp. 50-39]|uniref:cytochrome-c peroxidase n=1 Tax=Dyadobacter sp. 50-39 TaxID=1895756 RepID=UPI0009651464|nr:cytochrome c peroxidase [Dyadobacter sp. 50-39]OJV15042.1 MAG: cytochrome-c peroxidase [Dyadobacter sp. 50-39]